MRTNPCGSALRSRRCPVTLAAAPRTEHVLKPGRSLLDAVRQGYRALVASEQYWYLDPLKLFQQPWQRR